MKQILLLVLLGLTACGGQIHENGPVRPWIEISLDTIRVNSSIRALEVTEQGQIYYAGANGAFGFSEDGGITWHHDSIEVENAYPEFRAIAAAADAIFLLSVGSPAYLLRSEDKGKNWELVYTEEGESVFYDAMAFWDDTDGIAMGDPVGNCLSVIRTSDGGHTWRKISCDNLPQVVQGEAAFAASNTNISLHGDHVWIGTGGGAARIFHSADRGESWEVMETPLIQGGTMTGIFSVDFYNESTGVIFGGDWEAKSNSSGNAALTTDGGKTWQLISESKGPGYRSCVQFIPNGKGNEMIAVGIPGIAYSPDQGAHWQLLSDQDFYTIRFLADGSRAWLAGNGKIASMEIN